MHMDEGKPPFLSDELSLRRASDRKWDVVDASSADSTKSDKLLVTGRSDQSEHCRSDLANEPSVAVYYRNEEEVCEGFLIALRAMGVAVVGEPPEPAKPPGARAKP
jgi:hypothetical protein